MCQSYTEFGIAISFHIASNALSLSVFILCVCVYLLMCMILIFEKKNGLTVEIYRQHQVVSIVHPIRIFIEFLLSAAREKETI